MPARWFFCAPGAKLFRLPNAFVSNVYAKRGEESAPGPGETSRARVWDNGYNNGYLGQCFAGKAEWFKSGQLPASVLVPPPPPFDPCCVVPIRVGCPSCVGGFGPARMKLTAVGGSPSFANGIYFLDYLGFCTWQYVFEDGTSWTLQAEITWVVTYSGLVFSEPPMTTTWEISDFYATWNCFLPRTDWILQRNTQFGTLPTLQLEAP